MSDSYNPLLRPARPGSDTPLPDWLTPGVAALGRKSWDQMGQTQYLSQPSADGKIPDASGMGPEVAAAVADLLGLFTPAKAIPGVALAAGGLMPKVGKGIASIMAAHAPQPKAGSVEAALAAIQDALQAGSHVPGPKQTVPAAAPIPATPPPAVDQTQAALDAIYEVLGYPPGHPKGAGGQGLAPAGGPAAVAPSAIKTIEQMGGIPSASWANGMTPEQLAAHMKEKSWTKQTAYSFLNYPGLDSEIKAAIAPKIEKFFGKQGPAGASPTSIPIMQGKNHVYLNETDDAPGKVWNVLKGGQLGEEIGQVHKNSDASGEFFAASLYGKELSHKFPTLKAAEDYLNGKPLTVKEAPKAPSLSDAAIAAKLASDPGASIFDVAGVKAVKPFPANMNAHMQTIKDMITKGQVKGSAEAIDKMTSLPKFKKALSESWEQYKQENPKDSFFAKYDYQPPGFSAANPLLPEVTDEMSRQVNKELSPYQSPAYRGVGQPPRQMISAKPSWGDAYFSSAAPDLANKYATEYSSGQYGSAGRRPQVQPLALDTSGYFVHDAKGGSWSGAQSAAQTRMAELAKKEGKSWKEKYKGVIFHNVHDEPNSTKDLGPRTVYATFDPGTVRSRFAQFNPKKWGQNDLLGGLAGAAVGLPGAMMVLGHDGQVYDIGRGR